MSLTPAELLRLANNESKERVEFRVNTKKLDHDKQIVWGEVYAPNIIDSHGDMMEPEQVELLCHRFMGGSLNRMIDIMHNNKLVKAVSVESWIQREPSELWTVGSWVLATHIDDKTIWADVKSGKYNGYSFEAMVRKVPASVQLSVVNMNFGFVEPAADGHEHSFFVEVDDNGKVIGGTTSEDNGHVHKIRFGTATELAESHQHRYFLP